MSKQVMKHTAPESIPDKLYFRIGEVASLCGVETYVLRFWQTEFSQLRPVKSGTGQRLYRKRDVEMALRIKRLLHDEGYTIAGARQVFSAEAHAPRAQAQPELPLPAEASSTGQAASLAADRANARLARLRVELRELHNLLSGKPGSSQVPRPTLQAEPRKRDGQKLFDE